MKKISKEAVKKLLMKVLRFIANPRLLLCWLVAWMITNGWSYVFFAVGTWLNIRWMTVVGGAWLTFLWLPISPEKIATTAIAIALLRWWFPNDQQTLAVLRDAYEKTKQAFKLKKAEKAARKAEKEAHKAGDSKKADSDTTGSADSEL